MSKLVLDTQAESLAGDQLSRIKKWAPKVRTGCITCRIRRVKCDEKRPACRRCVSTGRKCDGYVSADSTLASTPTAPRPTVNIHASGSYLENRAFDYFRDRTLPILSRYRDDPIWTRTILQASHAMPSLWQAATALGAFHEVKISREEAEGSSQSMFHVKQYCTALRGLRDMLNMPKPPLDLIVLSSLLLIHVEALQDGYHPALMQIENVLRVLEFDNQRKVDNDILRLIQEIDDQGFLSRSLNANKPLLIDEKETVPAFFYSLAQAKEFITSQIGSLINFVTKQVDICKIESRESVPPEITHRAAEIAATFRQLDLQLQRDFFGEQAAELTVPDWNTALMLRAWTLQGVIIVGTSPYMDAMQFDEYMDEFNTIISLCSSVMNGEKDVDENSPITLDEGLLHPLFCLAVQCRESRIRRTALSLLDQLPSRTGILWDTNAIVKVAHLCVDFEESGLDKVNPSCNDIPVSQRIHNATLEVYYPQESDTTLSVTLWLRPDGTDAFEFSVHEVPLERTATNTHGKQWPTHVPVQPLRVWWKDTRITNLENGPSTLTAQTSTFDTSLRRLEYLKQRKKQLESN